MSIRGCWRCSGDRRRRRTTEGTAPGDDPDVTSGGGEPDSVVPCRAPSDARRLDGAAHRVEAELYVLRRHVHHSNHSELLGECVERPKECGIHRRLLRPAARSRRGRNSQSCRVLGREHRQGRGRGGSRYRRGAHRRSGRREAMRRADDREGARRSASRNRRHQVMVAACQGPARVGDGHRCRLVLRGGGRRRRRCHCYERRCGAHGWPRKYNCSSGFGDGGRHGRGGS